MKKDVLYYTVFAGLISCAGPGSDQQNQIVHTASGTAEDTLTFEIPETTGNNALVYQGTLSGPDNEFWIYSEQQLEITDAVEEVHIVPPVGTGGPDSSFIDEYMLTIVANHFNLHCEDLEDYSGTVMVFYNATRENKAAQFEVFQQKPRGQVRVYSPGGELIIDRQYNDEGNCIHSSKDVYAIDWNFNPSTAALQVSNLDDHETTDQEGGRLIELGPSMYPSSGEYQNDLYALLEKPVFENTFTINGEAFTGTLLGYFALNSTEKNPYFELRFLDGKLDGKISIYNEWGELELEELFAAGELVETLYKLDYADMEGMAKPVIYLYPQQEMAVHVKLDLKGHLTHSYPKYPDGGWLVNAKQNGTLYDQEGKEYYALFWEGVSTHEFTYSEGFVVKGNETEKFLESSLETIGLNRREANEFIMYWLPQMENNPYNLIHFSGDEYEQIAALHITPRPASLLRVMMVWSPLEEAVDIPVQDLNDLRVARKGFTVVEWGGKKQIVEPGSLL